MPPAPVISLLTDFGDADGYVGTMKGVMAGIAPDARFVDLTHQIGPQNIKQAAFTLMISTPFFPRGTVHLIVVDPGVGSHRRPIAARTPDALWVAPDNGVLSYVLADVESYTIHELANRDYQLDFISSTFHGRDIFSPAAAHLAAGVALEDFGPQVSDPVLMDKPTLDISDAGITGEVLTIDHFGNIRTSIYHCLWQDSDTLALKPGFGVGGETRRINATKTAAEVGPLKLDRIHNTFSDVGVGEPVAFIGSEGGVEISINQGDAAYKYGVKQGDEVRLTFG